MTTEPQFPKTEAARQDWLRRLPAELAIDAVGMWQIVPALRRRFGLEGKALESAVRTAIGLLLAAGAVPVMGYNEPEGSGWREVHREGTAREAMIEASLAAWRTLGRDPDFGDLWFATPAWLEGDAG